jgi:hypothetical protein
VIIDLSGLPDLSTHSDLIHVVMSAIEP